MSQEKNTRRSEPAYRGTQNIDGLQFVSNHISRNVTVKACPERSRMGQREIF
jgi:hypothetical protein